MFRFKAVFFLLFTLFSYSCQSKDFDFKGPKFVIVSNGDKFSAKAADYFFNHIQNRILDKGSVQFIRTDERVDYPDGVIYFELVPDLDADYEIFNEEGKLSIFAKDNKSLNWLSYMLINKLAEHHKIDVHDLPPNFLTFETGKYNYSMHYRDAHLQPNTNTDLNGVLNTHNVDVDWGIWGHNLPKIFSSPLPITSQALVNGKRDTDQLCFSAPSTYETIRDFVLDQYGRGDVSSNWFMIAPNDNNKVCTCETCVALGNTTTNATPAVIHLLNRLAGEYPNHYFYTIAYRTTKKAPNVKLAPNTGVFFSTVDLTKAPNIGSKPTNQFLADLIAWKKQSPSIYLWDYVSNFDEYLTPYPVLKRFKRHLNFFKEQGVDGFFLNGSGYDYSPFDDIKTYALSALMINSNLSNDTLVNNYTKRFYPQSGHLIRDYYLDLEKTSLIDNLDIDIYTPFRKAKNSYFDSKKFTTFYQELADIFPSLKGDERDKVYKLLGALSFVKLQLAYHDGTLANKSFLLEDGRIKLSDDVQAALNFLTKVYSDGLITKYKEEGGDLGVYLERWRTIPNTQFKTNNFSKAKAQGLLTKDYYKDAVLLSDNKKGFVSDFNQGWFLIGEDVWITGELNNRNEHKKTFNLVMRFLINERHRMLAPEQIDVYTNGKLLKQFNTNDFTYQNNVAILNKNINIPNGQPIAIRILKNKKLKNSVIACDEIQFL